MKKKNLLMLFTTSCLCLLLIFPSMAESKTLNGIKAKDYSNETYDTAVLDENGATYYVSSDDVDAWNDAVDAKKSENEALSKEDKEDVNNIISNSADKISSYKNIMEKLQPDADTGLNMLGEGAKNMIQKVFSFVAIIAFILFIASLIWNGINVVIPGIYSQTTGGDGQSGLAFGEKFLTQNTKNVAGGGDTGKDGFGKWFKGELKRIIIFVLVLVGLTSGLFFWIIQWVTSLIKF